jgi:transcriptional regulator with XRE-family HTH domain
MNALAIERERERTVRRAVALIRSKVASWPGGISHREIAERSGLSKNFVTRFLNDRAPNPELYSLAALATALGCRFEINLGDYPEDDE